MNTDRIVPVTVVPPTHVVYPAHGSDPVFAGSGDECFTWIGQDPSPGNFTLRKVEGSWLPPVVITETTGPQDQPLTTFAPATSTPVSVADAKAAGVFVAGRLGGESNGGNKIDVEAATRINAQRAMRKSMGLAVDETFYAPGTEMLQLGVDKYWTLRTPVEAQPPVPDCVKALSARIGKEERRDVVVSAAELATATLDEGGFLNVPGKQGAVQLNRKSLIDLLRRNTGAFPSATAWALSMGPEALAMSVTDGFRRGGRDGTLSDSMFRTRNHDTTGERVVWAVLGASYGAVDAHVAVAKVADALGLNTARGQWSYDPMTSCVEFTATWVNPIVVPRVGDTWQGYLKIRTRDDGQGRVWINCGGRDILCINCTEAEWKGDKAGVIHRGTAEAVLARVIEEGKQRLAQIRPLIESWGVLSTIAGSVTVNDEVLTGTQALTAMVLAPDMLGATLKDAGIAPTAMQGALAAAYERETRRSGSAMDLIGAITRAAHEARFLDAAQRFSLEQRAGQLVRIFADGTLES